MEKSKAKLGDGAWYACTRSLGNLENNKVGKGVDLGETIGLQICHLLAKRPQLSFLTSLNINILICKIVIIIRSVKLWSSLDCFNNRNAIIINRDKNVKV